MIKETVTMSHKELHRLQIIQEQAAARIGISIRQVKRLVQRYRNEGPSGLVSHRRGKRPNNSFSTEFRATVISLLKGRYADFGPTFACEKLREIHGLSLSVETLRKWMIEEGLWRERRRKIARIYQRRMRRPSYGELIQIDGSPHDWFENRGPRCTLIVFIDDATSALMALRFVPAETTRAYMETLRGYLNDHGVPLALYSDRHSIFRVNNPEREGELTQFTRAIKTLGIEPIHANSPQAKGRVERANQTLQDRLVKEMRLQNISDIEQQMHGCRPLLKPITTGSLRRLVLLIMLILMCTILKRNWVISSAYRRSAFCLKISLSSTKAVRFRYAVRAGDIDLGIRLLLYARTLTVKLTFCMTGKRWAGKSMLMARSLYHRMMKRVSMNEWIMPVLIYAQNTMLNLKLTIPGLRAERKVISKLSPRSYLKRSLIPIKKIETKIDSVECISIHRVDS
ncbi:putative integrase/transposase [Escherichia coli]|uniref:Putative integrase/transposase n=1 Tax=Escherichia coli TaxID=562 RepID=A0A376S6Y3_ECOLX|nr:putative integrase/transposase [Escherichia coli]